MLPHIHINIHTHDTISFSSFGFSFCCRCLYRFYFIHSIFSFVCMKHYYYYLSFLNAVHRIKLPLFLSTTYQCQIIYSMCCIREWRKKKIWMHTQINQHIMHRQYCPDVFIFYVKMCKMCIFHIHLLGVHRWFSNFFSPSCFVVSVSLKTYF